MIFTIIFSAWFISELLLAGFLHSKNTDKQHADKNSLSFIWVVIILSISIAIFISKNYYFPLSHNPYIEYAGLALVLTGVIARLAVVVSLGRFFTVDVTIRQNHQLKKGGFYKYLRHPSYSASLLSFIGLGISLNNWIALLFITATMLAVFIFRIRIEEKVLLEQFGSEYIEYKKHTSAIIPFIY